MANGANILVVDDEARVRNLLTRVLEEEGYYVETVTSGEEALSILENEEYDLVMTDLMMSGISGMELLEKIKEKHQELAVIIITAFGTVDSAVEAIKKGAFHYICKPFKLDEIRIYVKRALREGKDRRELTQLREEVQQRFGYSNIIGKSKAIQTVFELIRRVARTNSTVLIQGKSGTGKELVAKAIHYNSPRSNNPFVAINCSAITETLLESELFGHEKGSFTGAVARKKGLYELAQNGTIFLDEIGEISPAVQVKLLRVLQEHEIRRVGGTQNIKVDVRMIAATNRDLGEAVRKEEYREDFYYRLNVVPIHLPTLKDRRDDIPLLAQHFLKKLALESGSKVIGISKEAMRALDRYSWPGNIRELENVIERAITLGAENEIRLEDLPRVMWDGEEEMDFDVPSPELPMAEIEKQHIQRVLRFAEGHYSKAAKILGIDRRTLYRKVETYHLRDE